MLQQLSNYISTWWTVSSYSCSHPCVVNYKPKLAWSILEVMCIPEVDDSHGPGTGGRPPALVNHHALMFQCMPPLHTCNIHVEQGVAMTAAAAIDVEVMEARRRLL